jgi:hypothetical protein
MKKTIFLGLFLSLLTYAEENPFSLNENFQKIDKDQEALLSCFKDINENKVDKKVVKHPTHTTIKPRNIVPKHEGIKVGTSVVKKVIKEPIIPIPKKTIQSANIKQVDEERAKAARVAQRKWINQKREKEALLKEKAISSQKQKVPKTQKIEKFAGKKVAAQKALAHEKKIILEKKKREKAAKIARAKKIREERAEAMRIKKLAKEKREAQKRVEEKRVSKEKVKVRVSQKRKKIQRQNLVVKNVTQKRILHQSTKKDLVTLPPKRKSVDEINLEEEALAKKKAAEKAYLDAIKEVDK